MIIKYFIHQCRDIIPPQLPNNGKNNYEYKKLCNNVAIIWGNNIPICERLEEK
jgi:hypothetical protein